MQRHLPTAVVGLECGADGVGGVQTVVEKIRDAPRRVLIGADQAGDGGGGSFVRHGGEVYPPPAP